MGMAKRHKKPSASSERTVIKNMGLFWKRDDVIWVGNRGRSRAMLGLRSGAKRAGVVDFWDQAGIYALYAEYRLVYVGQAGMGDASCIGSRLKQHTKDYLAGRWDMFSWFGLRTVNGNNTLRAKAKRAVTTWPGIADILEGILIEVAEPPMNSQQGRFGGGVHRYIQRVPDGKMGLEEKLDSAQSDLERVAKRLEQVWNKVKRRS